MRTLPDIDLPCDNFYFERKLRAKGFACIAGVDEVGRGPLAGPVVAACVSLPEQCDPSPFLDSKKISHRRRVELACLLRENGATIGFGIVSHKLIDSINILQSSLLAMKLAVFHHSVIATEPDFLLVDGTFNVPLQISQQHLTKGESKSGSIAAASIVAKLQRDAIMD
ncbi:MAG: ribonuclease HII, partial [Desulfopila sp.]|nr:ribonuclease HII [Desulfopila sp.]